jgi:recombination protein RecA
MNPAALRSSVGARFSTDFRFRPAPPAEAIPTGIPDLDRVHGGLPRGAITEIHGAPSSGRTSLLLSVLAEAGARGESVALVDVSDSFDPASAGAAGVDLSRLVWVRCGGSVENALRAADLLVAAGGFGLVVMDLGDAPPRQARRISLASWFRFRRTVEHSPVVMLVLGRESYVSCASLQLEMRREKAEWTGAPGCSELLAGFRITARARKPVRSETSGFRVRAVG